MSGYNFSFHWGTFGSHLVNWLQSSFITSTELVYCLIMASLVSIFELGALISSIGLLLAYHLISYSHLCSSDKNFNSQLAKNVANATYWLSKHKEKADAPSVTLTIQTLRNTILVAIFIGGFSLQLAINSLQDSKDLQSSYAQLCGGIVGVFLIFSFLCWANVIRSCSHLGYVIGILSFLDPLALVTSSTQDSSTSTLLEIDVKMVESNRLLNSVFLHFR